MEEKSRDAKQLDAGKAVLTVVGRLKPIHLTIALILLVGITMAVGNREFLSLYNINTILTFGAILLIAALGQMFAILIGGIDLSVGGTISLISVIFVFLVHRRQIRGLSHLPGDRLVIGYVNGIILTRVKIPSFIATLGTGGIITSLAYLVSPRPVDAPPEDYGYFDIVNGSVLGMSNVFILAS